MRGSAALRASVAPGGALAGPWVRDALWRRARAIPRLDLRFADNKSLVDATTGAQLVTFTRASSGTFVGSDGVLQTAVTNLLTFSEQLDDSAWTKTRSSITANAETAPTGALTADKLVEDTTASNSHRLDRSFTWVSGTDYTYSVFCKAAERTRVRISLPATAFTSISADFNLSAGTITAGSGTIVAFGNGWYRCAITGTANASTTASILHPLLDGTGNASYTGDGTSGIFLWGAQLEQSTTVGEYIPTTSTINSAPRFDHNPETGESLGLLVEEQRTNLLLRSEEFGVSPTWSPTDASITSDSVVAPTGLQTADTYTEAATGTPGIFQTVSGLIASTVYTGSIYLKRGDNDWYRLLFVDNSTFANGARAWINLATGAFGTVENVGTGTGVASSITPLANGWYRVSLSTAMGGANTVFRFQLNSAASNGSSTRVFNTVAYLWGAQLEAGAFPTSYIPTTTASATRSADVASISGSNFSSWYRQDEGTVFAHFVVNGDKGANQFIYDIAGGTAIAEEIFALKAPVTNSTTNTIRSSSAIQATFSTDGQSGFGTQIRNAVGVSASSTNVAVNGALQTEDPLVTMPTVDNLVIGQRSNSTFSGNFSIRRLAYWPARLPNSTLQTITQ